MLIALPAELTAAKFNAPWALMPISLATALRLYNSAGSACSFCNCTALGSDGYDGALPVQ